MLFFRFCLAVSVVTLVACGAMDPGVMAGDQFVDEVNDSAGTGTGTGTSASASAQEQDAGVAAFGQDAGTDVGAAPDAGQEFVDSYCNQPETSGYINVDYPYDLAFDDGRTGAKVVQFSVQSCAVPIEIASITIETYQFNEADQVPQAPDDPTGLLIANGVQAFANQELRFASGNQVPVWQVFRPEPSDSSSLAEYVLQDKIRLEPHANISFTVRLDIAENAALAGSDQAFNLFAGAKGIADVGGQNEAAVRLRHPGGVFPSLTVRYRER